MAIAAAPVVFVLLWSTGFIGARYGLPYIEPLTFLAVRMALVVVLMGTIAVAGRVLCRAGAKSAAAFWQARWSTGCIWVVYLLPSAKASRPAFQH